MSHHEHEITEDELWEELPSLEGHERAHNLIMIASFRYDADDFGAGLELSREAAATFETAGDMRGHGMSLEFVARGLNGTCEHGEAITTLQRAVTVLEEHGEPGDLLSIYDGLGHCYRAADDYTASKEAFETAYEIVRSQASPTRSDLATSASQAAGAVDSLGGDDAKMIEYLDEALEAARGDASTHWIARMSGNLVRAHVRQGNFDEARAMVRDMVTVARHCECPNCLADALVDEADIAQHEGDNDTARAAYTEAVAAAKKASNGEPTKVDAHMQLFLSTVADDRVAALDHIAQAEALYTVVGFDWGLANCIDHRGLLAERFGDLDTALRQYSELEHEITKVAGRRELAELLYKVARIQIQRGNASAAVTVLQGAGYIDGEPGTLDSRERARHYALYAAALAGCGNNHDALLLAEQVLTATSESGWYEVAASIHETRARVLQHSDPAAAERAAQRAQASFNQAGLHGEATRIGYEFFIRPYETLARIDLDNQARAEAEDAERRVRAEESSRWEQAVVAKSALPDPIEGQVERSDTSDGQANSASA